MSNKIRIDFSYDDELFEELLVLSDNSQVLCWKASEHQYNLSGNELFTFIGLSIASGVIGSTAFEIIKSLLKKTIRRIGKRNKEKKSETKVIIAGNIFIIQDIVSANKVLKSIDKVLNKKNK